MKDIRLKCSCKCGQQLFIQDFGDGQIEINIRQRTERKYRYGVVVDRKKLGTLYEL